MKVVDKRRKRKRRGDGIPAFLEDLLDRAEIACRNSQVSRLHAIATALDMSDPAPLEPADPCWCGHAADLHKHLDDCRGGDCDCRKFVSVPYPFRQCDGTNCDCFGFDRREHVPYEQPDPFEYGSSRGVSENPFERNK